MGRARALPKRMHMDRDANYVAVGAFVLLVIAMALSFVLWYTNQKDKHIYLRYEIYFPGTDQVKAGGSLDPAKFPVEITQYAGQQVDNGDKAKAYANDFIGVHLQGVAGGKTYSQVSSAASALNAQIASTPKTDPNYATLQAQAATLTGQKATLFQGEMLRGTLLNSWGWWTVGVYTAYAAVGLMIAALVALVALVFELFIAGRKPETFKVAQKLAV